MYTDRCSQRRLNPAQPLSTQFLIPIDSPLGPWFSFSPAFNVYLLSRMEIPDEKAACHDNILTHWNRLF